MSVSSREALLDDLKTAFSTNLADAITQTGTGSVGDGYDITDPGASVWFLGPLAVDPVESVVFWLEPISETSSLTGSGITSGAVPRVSTHDLHTVRLTVSVVVGDGGLDTGWRKVSRYVECLKYILSTDADLAGPRSIQGFSVDIGFSGDDDLLYYNAILELQIIDVWTGP